jgi:hypothetical protein
MEDPQHAKETKTAEELAAMIREDPSKMDGCPECPNVERWCPGAESNFLISC